MQCWSHAIFNDTVNQDLDNSRDVLFNETVLMKWIFIDINMYVDNADIWLIGTLLLIFRCPN